MIKFIITGWFISNYFTLFIESLVSFVNAAKSLNELIKRLPITRIGNYVVLRIALSISARS